MQLRPSIDNVLKRFEHIHALLVTTSSANSRFNSRAVENVDVLNSHRGTRIQLSTILERLSTIMDNDGRAIEMDLSITGSLDNTTSNLGPDLPRKECHMPEMMRIMGDVFIASDFWLERRVSRALKLGITHVIVSKQSCSRQIKDMFTTYQVDCDSSNSFKLSAGIMDFLRKVALFKGKVLFVELREKWSN